MSIDVFGYIAGVFGILAVGYGILCSQLPQAKYRNLEAVLKDTQDILQESCENGLLTDCAVVTQMEEQLWRYKEDAANVRTRALSATSFWQQCAEIVSGLPKLISGTTENVSNLRAYVLTVSDKERKRLNESGHRNNFSTTTPLRRHIGCDDQRTLTDAQLDPTKSTVSSRKPANIPGRTRSCPPEISDDNGAFPPTFLLDLRNERLKAQKRPGVFYGPPPNELPLYSASGQV